LAKNWSDCSAPPSGWINLLSVAGSVSVSTTGRPWYASVTSRRGGAAKGAMHSTCTTCEACTPGAMTASSAEADSTTGSASAAGYTRAATSVSGTCPRLP
jgi:hypothetical protein